VIPGAHSTVALIGFMGAGKTTLGRALAIRLGVPFADADDEIARIAGKPIAAIFADSGEAAFRELEARVACDLLAGEGVVALGGGAVAALAVRAALRRESFTILLDVSPDAAWRRARATGHERPLANDPERFAGLHEERRAVYHATADALVDADDVDGEELLLVPLARYGALAELPRLVAGRRAALVADEHVLDVVGAPLADAAVVPVPAGEAAKTPEIARRVWEALAGAGHERGDVVVGFGGGAATDLAGFAAATYLRGVPWIAAPTTLLGMVDAAVGGKTAVDLPAGKNLVGAFHAPEWIVADPAALETLPDHEWRNGFAEVVKTALLAGGRLWEMTTAWPPGRGTADARLELIRRSAAYKARVVARDPTERSLRAALNLGHTIGHAVEAAAAFRGLAHGEAVAVGLLPALWLSARLAGLDPAVEDEARILLARHGLPTAAPGLDAGAVHAALAHDKKRRGGRVRFTLLEAVGRPSVGHEIPDELVAEAVARAIAGSR
jgi:shikimate kinase/3-dehydroquinate synthase